MANLVVRHDGGQVARQARELGRRALFEPLRELMRWDPFAEMWPAGREREIMFMPDFDIKETPDAIVFRADLPGIEEKDIDVTVTGNRITVSGKREAEEEQKGETWYACERSYGSFTRSFTLPEGSDAEHVRASLDKGVLSLHIPKTEKAQSKKVPIGAAKPKA